MKINLTIPVIALLVLSSCASSRIVSSWKTDQPYSDIKKVVVLGLTGEAEKAFCIKMEKHLTEDLATQGYNAFSAYQEYGPNAFEKMSEEEAVGKLTGKGFDAVITIILLNKEREEYFVPARYKSAPPYHNGFWDYYTTRYDMIYSTGYYEKATRYFWESNLYDLTAKKLIYSCQTESFDPASSEALGHEYGSLIVENMVAKGVLPASVKKPF